MFQYSQLFMIIVFFLNHLSHFLEFLLVSFGHLGPYTCIRGLLPNRLSSISDFLATYLAFKDLLCRESDVF